MTREEHAKNMISSGIFAGITSGCFGFFAAKELWGVASFFAASCIVHLWIVKCNYRGALAKGKDAV